MVEKEDNELQLSRIDIKEAHKLWEMQVKAFAALYQKYQDTETSPAAETVERIMTRLQQPFTYYYWIQENGENVGAVRVVDKKDAQKNFSDFYSAAIPKSGTGTKGNSCS